MKLFLLTYDELRKSIISLNVGKNKVYRPIYSKNCIPNGNDLVLYLNVKVPIEGKNVDWHFQQICLPVFMALYTLLILSLFFSHHTRKLHDSI